MMDAYTRRIVIRLGWKVNGDKYTYYQQLFESKFGTPDIGMWGDFHAQLDGHAARVCRKLNPLRGECTLLDLCPTGKKVSGVEHIDTA